jgi:hypothetical protein
MAPSAASRPRPPRADARRRDGDLLRDAFRRRAREAVERAASSASPEALADALSAPTDLGALARLLGSVASGAAAELEPLADAVARGVEARERLVARTGGLLTAARMGAALGGITRQAVDKRRRGGQLLAVRVGTEWRYPVVQTDRDGTIPKGLATVVKAMADAGGWATLDFLLAPDDALGGLTPLDALKRGGAPAAAVLRQLAAAEADAYS